MKKRSPKDGWRREYIRLLTDPLGSMSNFKIERDATPERREEMERIAELIQAGFMRGEVVRSRDGAIGVSLQGTTLEGRIFAEEQQQILDKNSLLGHIKSGATLFIGWLSGIISALLIWFLTK